MKRHILSPRSNWQDIANDIGFTYYATPAEPDYGTNWNESVAYEFSSKEVDELESATEELHTLCLSAVDYVVNESELLSNLGIPSTWHNYVRDSWKRGDHTLYGRFDLAYDGHTPPKMLEYNADTPTMLIESSVMQWTWLQEKFAGYDQFNSVHEKLLEQFIKLKGFMNRNSTMHFSGLESKEEERQTCRYLQDLAMQAGIKTKFIDINQIGYENTTENFVDLDNEVIQYCFKLYPWEWIFNEEFGKFILDDKVAWIEPVWKSILSNKGIMPILWKLFPNHPNLLASTYNRQDLNSDNFVVKPFLSREGQNIEWHQNGNLVKKTDGVYHSNKVIYQETANLFNQETSYAVIGSWIIASRSAGIIVRDHNDSIIHDRSDVVPHWFV